MILLAVPNSTSGCCPSGILQICLNIIKYVSMFPKYVLIKGFLRLFQKANMLQTIMEVHKWRASWSVDMSISLLNGFGKKPLNPQRTSLPP